MQPSTKRSAVGRRLFGACVALLIVAGLPAVARAQSAPPLRSTVFPADSARSRRTGNVPQRSIVDTATAILAKLEMHETTIAAGAMPHPAHKHVHEELIVVRSGTIEVLLDSKTLKAGPGDIAFMASNEMHGFRNPGPGTASYLVIRLDTRDQPPEAKP
ncbi:MAG: cupin domain-containing protein [bacterium]